MSGRCGMAARLIVALVAAAGCSESNPRYHGPADGGPAAVVPADSAPEPPAEAGPPWPDTATPPEDALPDNDLALPDATGMDETAQETEVAPETGPADAAGPEPAIDASAGPPDQAPEGPPGPTLTLNKSSYASGEAIVATFASGPGNARDWIGIYEASDPTPDGDLTNLSTIWYYLDHTQDDPRTVLRNGQLTFAAGSRPTWPLPSGDYKAYFLANDIYIILAGPVFFTVR
jgi:hypothetical protein